MKQSKFLKSIRVLILIITTLSSVVACKDISENKIEAKAPFFKLSLAQWSFHRTFRSDETSPYEFAKMANELGFEGLLHLTGFSQEFSMSHKEDLDRTREL